MIITVIILVVALAALFAIWRVRFRYPPDDIPHTLCYHKISRRFCLEGTWTTPSSFERQIDGLLGADFRFIDERVFLERLERPVPAAAREILLTFDDGYESVIAACEDILLPRAITPHIFLLTDYVGKTNDWDLSLGRPSARHMDWQQVRDLARRGVTFGSHGACHRDLTRVGETDLQREVAASKAVIEEQLHSVARTFSYPFGRYDTRAIDAVRSAGYDAAFSLYPAHANARVDRFALRRNGVYIIDTPGSVRRKLGRGALFWLEEMKCRCINGVAVLTPIFKRYPTAPGK